MPWRADLVQAVIFAEPGSPQLDALKLWSYLFKDEGPDNFQRANTISAASIASGQKGDWQLNLSAQLNRVDLVYQAKAQPPGAGEPPQIEDFAAACIDAARCAGSVASQLIATRLAIVLHLTEKIEPAHDASALTEKTGVRFPEGAADCSYQFNVRKPINSVPKVEMNRLCTWATGQYQVLSLTVGSGQMPVAMASSPFVSLKIDVNSIPGPKFDQTKVGAFFEELAKEALQIAENGVGVFQ